MFRLGLYLIVAITMFSSVCRAFSTPAVARGMNRMAKPSFIARSMSTTGEAETSIVDVCKGKISKALETDDVTVTGAYDDPNGSHISIKVVSPMFEGKRPVQRQQLVYKALWEELKGAVHAVDSMVCKTPDEN
mmetsp:Transcript_25174/g.38449  ORF Transcript_25174/g.38449 Transcript_25174/m.38449 type:complete len:133 (-) Transcript_25174:1093-1491(-)